MALGIAPEGRLDLAGIGDALAQPFVLQDALFTLALAGSATLITVVCGLPVAYVFARFEFRGRSLARALATVPFVLPTVVVASAFVALLGPRSPINQLLTSGFGLDRPPIQLAGTVWAVLLASVFYNLAVVLRLVGGLWSHLDPQTEEAARVLGASGWRAFREVTWPLLRPAVASAASIVFLFNVTSFGLVLLLGSAGTTTLEVEIYRQTAELLDLRTAAALSILQMGGVLALLLAYARAQERLSVVQRLRPASETARRPRTARERTLVFGVLGALGLFLGLPLAVLVERSFAGSGGYGLDAYTGLFTLSSRGGLFVPPVEAIQNSLVFGVVTLGLATSLGLLAAVAIASRRGWLSRAFDALVMLPLGTSAVTVGFGFIVALDEPPLDLRTSPLLIPIAHSLIAMPFVLRVLVPVIRSIDPRLREAAAVLGAAPSRVWREVDLPVIRRAVLVGGAFAFAVSLGEFGATVFVARPDTPTIPVAVARLLGLPGGGPFGQAMAMSTVLMLLTALALLGVERFRGSAPQPF
ncbi:MAG: thiamine transport system permease protein [Chloroflexota bacterium]|nr:thiamine transport system permease protein [Chloroflexota bacterium]